MGDAKPLEALRELTCSPISTTR